MPVTETRIRPLLQLRVMHAGQGDPIVTSPHLGWYDLLAETCAQGTISRTSDYNYTLEYIKDVGLVCRAFVVLKDTRSSQYTTSGGGSWEERRPSTGSPRVYRLVQYNPSGGLQYAATANFFLPADPQVAFTYISPDTPAAHNSSSLPPFVRFEFGNHTWALEFSRVFGARLLKRVGGLWVMFGDLPQPGSLGSDLDERMVILRVLRGRICVSLDFGKTYAVFGEADGAAITVPASPFTVRGQGGYLSFGLQQVLQVSGTYTSPTLDTLDHRDTPSATITARQQEPPGTTLTFTDLATPGRYAQYQVEFSPSASTVPNGPFPFYRTPEVYAVNYQFAADTSLGTGLGTASTPFADILEASIQEPLELDGATCSVRARLHGGGPWAGAYRYSKCQVVVGEWDAGGEITWIPKFLGYLRNPAPGQAEYNRAEVTLTLDHASLGMKAKEWPPYTVPYGGLTLNDALTAILATEGLTPVTNWHSRGDVELPAGSPEDPAYWPKRGERKWEFMAQMCRDCGLELGVRPDGTWYTVPRDYQAPFIGHVFDANPTEGELRNAIRSIQGGADASEAATAICVSAKDQHGIEVTAFGVDEVAERNPAHPRFCEIGRIIRQRELSGTSTRGQANLALQGDFAELTALKEEYTLTLPLNLGVTRRDLVQIRNCEPVGPTPAQVFVVLTQLIQLRPSLPDSSTTLGVRRVL